MAEQKKCFVIMPFGKRGSEEHKNYLWIYEKMIKPVVTEHGYLSVRADELDHIGNITKDIISLLHDAELVIADLSDKNANVFYELGVRHALFQCGTIPIIREGENLPFDIVNYRTIFYSDIKEGPELFREELARRIKAFQNRKTSISDNPVHDTLKDQLIQIDVIRQQIKDKEDELKNIETKYRQLETDYRTIQSQQKKQSHYMAEWAEKEVNYEQKIAKLQNDLRSVKEVHQRLTNDLSQQKAVYEQKITELEAQLQQLKPAKPSPAKPPQIIKPRFRSEPKTLSSDDAAKMIKEKNFFDSRKNEKGTGFENQYEELNLKGEKIVFDKASGLMWQQGGSDKSLIFKDAEAYIQKLNKDKFGGFDDWRLPTLEEAMSLMEPNKNQADLYLDGCFDATQRWIWTADEYAGGSSRWYVSFDNGHCHWPQVDSHNFVRGVRFRQSSEGSLNI